MAGYEHREWIKLYYAASQFEATMIQSFLESEDIESMQPFSRSNAYDTGLGPGVAGELGVRIDVPADQFERAAKLLTEKLKSVKESRTKS